MATPKAEVEGQYAADGQKDNDVGLKEQVESQGTSQELPKPLEQTSSTEAKSKFTSWAKGLKMPSVPTQGASMESAKSAFGLFTGSFIKRAPGKIPVVDATEENATPQAHDGALGTFTKGFLDTSKNAMKAVQTRARHLVSQNKRRYQEGGFDLDMSYITENIIAMGFPAGDMSSGLLGYVEGFYRNHMEEVIKFFETRHKDKYKVYNLCSERLYDPSLLEGKVACFPFDDHNCPPLQLVMAFCQSAYSWLKGDLANVVVVHCKAGMARTGLMISCLLLYLKFFPTAEESISHYNQMRCIDSKGLVLPSQLRYVKYFERVLKDFAGETPSGRKCILRGIRLHKCPYWIRPSITVSDHSGVLFSTKKHSRTKDMMPEDFWFSAPRKGIMVFALPGERCVADLNGDFKINFQDRQGDFYCWLNTNMMENRQLLKTSELDGFDKRRVPSPGFQVEVVILDSDATPASRVQHAEPQPASDEARVPQASQAPDREKDDVFSDSESEEADGKSKSQKQSTNMKGEEKPLMSDSLLHNTNISQESGMPSKTKVHDMPVTGKNTVAEGDEDKKARDDVHKSLVNPISGVGDYENPGLDASAASSDFKSLAVASAADASVFTFGDDEDFESEEE